MPLGRHCCPHIIDNEMIFILSQRHSVVKPESKPYFTAKVMLFTLMLNKWKLIALYPLLLILGNISNNTISSKTWLTFSSFNELILFSL